VALPSDPSRSASLTGAASGAYDLRNARSEATSIKEELHE
jgi:hypothetical protein